MPLTHPAADVWTLLADIAEETPGAPAFIHGERTISLRRAARRRRARGAGPRRSRRRRRAIAWRCGCPTCRPIPILYFACARLGAIAVAVNTRYRAVEVADIVGRSGAKVLACAPGFRRIDFLSILADIDPAALDKLAAIVIVGEEPADRPARHRAAAARAVRPPAVAPAVRRQPRPAQRALQHLHDLGHDQRAQVRAAPPGRDRRATPSRWRASSASPRPTRSRSRSCRCAASSASTRRWRRSPPASPACWSSPTRSTRSPG